MIRVRKSEAVPAALSEKGYQDDSVKKALLNDQDEKCYICERKVTTDYQVEHLASQKNNNDKKNEWDNLFIACSYCNNKKKTEFDDIKYPNTYNIEEEIVHLFDPMNERVEFSTESTDEGVIKTLCLLRRMFNGTNAPMRSLMETRFYNQFKLSYNHFLAVVHDYLSGRKDEMRPIIEQMIDIKSEYLAFKYAIIMQNATLRRDFEFFMKWNKE